MLKNNPLNPFALTAAYSSEWTAEMKTQSKLHETMASAFPAHNIPMQNKYIEIAQVHMFLDLLLLLIEKMAIEAKPTYNIKPYYD